MVMALPTTTMGENPFVLTSADQVAVFVPKIWQKIPKKIRNPKSIEMHFWCCFVINDDFYTILMFAVPFFAEHHQNDDYH